MSRGGDAGEMRGRQLWITSVRGGRTVKQRTRLGCTNCSMRLASFSSRAGKASCTPSREANLTATGTGGRGRWRDKVEAEIGGGGEKGVRGMGQPVKDGGPRARFRRNVLCVCTLRVEHVERGHRQRLGHRCASEPCPGCSMLCCLVRPPGVCVCILAWDSRPVMRCVAR